MKELAPTKHRNQEEHSKNADIFVLEKCKTRPKRRKGFVIRTLVLLLEFESARI